MTTTQGTVYNLDIAHSEIGFKIKHLGLSTVKGAFKVAEAQVVMDGEDISTLDATAKVEVASIDTKNDDRDNHLRSADFFHAEQHPYIHFATSGVSEVSGNSFKLHGALEICGVSHPIILDATFLGNATDPWGNERIGFEATGSFNRKDFGLTWNQVLEAGSLLVGEEVRLALDIQAIKS